MDYGITIYEFNKMVNESLEYSNIDFNFDIRRCKSFIFNTCISCEVIVNDLYLFMDTTDFIVDGNELFEEADEIYFELDWEIQRRVVNKILDTFDYAGALLNYGFEDINKLIFSDEFLRMVKEKDFIIRQHTLVGQDT